MASRSFSLTDVLESLDQIVLTSQLAVLRGSQRRGQGALIERIAADHTRRARVNRPRPIGKHMAFLQCLQLWSSSKLLDLSDFLYAISNRYRLTLV